MNRQTKLRMIRALYAELPTVECKGMCSNSCGPIDMSEVERDRLAQLGVKIPIYSREDHQAWQRGERLDCPALTPVTQHPLMPKVRMASCTVHAERPLICRLWGVAESMPCDLGCKVSPRMLTDEEAFDFIYRALLIGGEPKGRSLAEGYERQKALMADPDIAPLMRRFIRGDKSVEPEIARLIHERL